MINLSPRAKFIILVKKVHSKKNLDQHLIMEKDLNFSTFDPGDIQLVLTHFYLDVF